MDIDNEKNDLWAKGNNPTWWIRITNQSLAPTFRSMRANDS